MSRWMIGLIAMAISGMLLSCASLPNHRAEQRVQGILKHFPPNVKSVQAWHGHEYMIGETPILSTATVPDAELQKHVGAEVLISGTWHPGEIWDPHGEDAFSQAPVGGAGAIRGDGLRAARLERIN